MLPPTIREEPMKKRINTLTTIFFTIMLLVGLSVMLYPTVSDWWNARVSSRAIENYEQTIAVVDTSEVDAMLEAAHQYNQQLATLSKPFSDYEKVPDYESILNLSGTGIMGYISIPMIQVEIPIYHGTSATVLNNAAGHLQGSTLPVGGASTHCVISAHRGLPSARLFTDLDKLVEGDVFTLSVLGVTYTYEIAEIHIVEPYEFDQLAIEPGADYVTLMTCTPYGINTQRLLLKAKRIETVYVSHAKVTAEAVKVDSVLIVPLIAAPFVLLLILYWVFGGKNRKNTPSVRYMLYDPMNNQKG